MKPYYEEKGITIFCGDCREILPQLGKFDLLLTDPPYGIGADTHEGPVSSGWTQWNDSGWDKEPVTKEHLQVCRDSSLESVIWGGNYFELPPSMGWLVWNKGQRDFSLADGELAWTTRNKALRIFDYSRGAALQDGRQHPTQKPIALMKWCLSLFPEAKTVLDPFLGSGTTFVAAKAMGLTGVGIEQEEKYCEIAANRLRQEVFDFSSTA